MNFTAIKINKNQCKIFILYKNILILNGNRNITRRRNTENKILSDGQIRDSKQQYLI